MNTYEISALGINEVNAKIKENLPLILASLTPFIGQKLVKADYYLTEKAKQVVHKTDCFYFDISKYSIWAKFRHVVNDGGHAHYFDTSVYLGTMDGQTLTCLREFDELVDVHDLDEIQTPENLRLLVDNIKAAERAFSEAKNKLPNMFKGGY